jgi:hypothetical protein
MPDLPEDVLPEGYTDSWDAFRAADWELGTTSLTTLLGMIGVADKPVPEQQSALLRWSDTAAYVPAPAPLKAKVREFIRSGYNPDGGEA